MVVGVVGSSVGASVGAAVGVVVGASVEVPFSGFCRKKLGLGFQWKGNFLD